MSPESRGRFLETPDSFPGPVSIFSTSSANANYWRKRSDMLHEIVKINI